ncbi:MAG: hypothetical protein K0V04_17470 [Deltaproteobacteria bacterium]|nr:hypothetical protein [Deltaproteobacteria bacterium]
MPSSRASNPIEQRLAVLHDQWTEFAQDDDARVLRWLVARDEVRMIETFVEVEGHQKAGSTPDVFLLFRNPFENPLAHGYVVREELVAGYEPMRASLIEDGFDGSWLPPAAGPRATDVEVLRDTGASFREHYAALPMAHLVLVLLPQHADDPSAWVQWLDRWIASAPPKHLRMIVLDDVDAPILDTVAEHPAVTSIKADLDMPRAIRAIVQKAGHQDKPGGAYRLAYVDLAQAAGRGDLVRAKSAADKATAVAMREGWHYLVVPAKLALASAYLQAQQLPDAIAACREADQAGAAAHEAGDDNGPRLRLHSQLTLGATLLSSRMYPQAATVYENAVPLAQEVDPELLYMECWRMAAYCHEADAQWPRAWSCGLEALGIGQHMEPTARRGSTLAYVGEGLLRITARRDYASQARTIELKMVELLGTEDWRPKGPAHPPYPPPPMA